MAERPSQLERTAYHEAGHAVAAFVLRRAFVSVSIEPGEESLGHVLGPRNLWGKFRPDIEPNRARIEKEVMVSFAGAVAEGLFAGRRNWRGARGDTHGAIDLLSYLTGSNEELSAYSNWLWVCTVDVMQNPGHWAAVKALADELLKRKHIGHITARKIFRQAWRDLLAERHDARDARSASPSALV